jgi:hypothetical protein
MGATMPKLVEELKRDIEKIYLVVDPITVDRINDLLATGDFKGLSDLIRN